MIVGTVLVGARGVQRGWRDPDDRRCRPFVPPERHDVVGDIRDWSALRHLNRIAQLGQRLGFRMASALFRDEAGRGIRCCRVLSLRRSGTNPSKSFMGPEEGDEVARSDSSQLAPQALRFAVDDSAGAPRRSESESRQARSLVRQAPVPVSTSPRSRDSSRQ